MDSIYLKTLLERQQVDSSTYTSVVINAPAKVVWGYFTDERQADFTPAIYQLETGAWGEIGSVFATYSTEGGKVHPFPKIRFKVTDSIPYKYHLLRITIQPSADAVETFIGYDVFVLEESNDVSKLIFIQPLVFGNLNIPKGALPAFREGQGHFIAPLFENLKRLVESKYKR